MMGLEKKRALSKQGPCEHCGGEEEDRTPDLRIANATLSQLSYPPTTMVILAKAERAFRPSCGFQLRRGEQGLHFASDLVRVRARIHGHVAPAQALPFLHWP